MKCKFYSASANICMLDDPRQECSCKDEPSECFLFEPGERIEYGSSNVYEDEMKAAKLACQKSSIKLELVQYPYSKSGPTVYLDDWQIAGPRAFGVGKTIANYELTEGNLKDIQRIVTRELNRLHGAE